ncbi:hypothetical protein F2P81_024338 [Scophthalmus maximus]|uniref:Uncharacterized protein n=1 Tax=Scophthalmus maximus TaxID=52904 RepID=A0A6A4RUJ5_SCOMX|nr:hypothetical protein F2P81_024338 [Scophthalmus maximus]
MESCFASPELCRCQWKHPHIKEFLSQKQKIVKVDRTALRWTKELEKITVLLPRPDKYAFDAGRQRSRAQSALRLICLLLLHTSDFLHRDITFSVIKSWIFKYCLTVCHKQTWCPAGQPHGSTWSGSAHSPMGATAEQSVRLCHTVTMVVSRACGNTIVALSGQPDLTTNTCGSHNTQCNSVKEDRDAVIQFAAIASAAAADVMSSSRTLRPEVRVSCLSLQGLGM